MGAATASATCSPRCSARGFRNQFAEDYVQAGDEHKGNANGNSVSVDVGVWNLAENLLDHVGEERFANPTQGQTYDRDPQLNPVDHFIQIAVQLLDNAGTNTAGFDQLLNAGLANADQGKLGRSKERVGCDQKQNQEHPDQHEGDHGWLILTFQR